jgi:hypothetical protein
VGAQDKPDATTFMAMICIPTRLCASVRRFTNSALAPLRLKHSLPPLWGHTVLGFQHGAALLIWGSIFLCPLTRILALLLNIFVIMLRGLFPVSLKPVLVAHARLAFSTINLNNTVKFFLAAIGNTL